VLLPQTSKDQALVVAKRLRDGLRTSAFCRDEGLNLNVRASIGLATYPHDARTAHDVIRQADGMMYVVKNSSRDNIGIAQRGMLKESGELLRVHQRFGIGVVFLPSLRNFLQIIWLLTRAEALG
jgi:predicted signal transduction protein with EAL and GGDEF domain